MTQEGKTAKILATDKETQFSFVYPDALHTLEKKGASEQDIADILTARATVNEIRSKLQLAPIPYYGADELFFVEPAGLFRNFPGAVFNKVRNYWQATKSKTASDFWEQTRDVRRDTADVLLKLEQIGQDVYDFLIAD